MLSSSPLMAATLLYQYNHFNLKSSHKIFTWFWLLRKLSSLPNLLNLKICFLYRFSKWLSTHSQLKINESLQICKLFAIETIVTISLNTYIYLYIYILSYSVCTSVQYYNSFSQHISLLSLEPNTIWMSGWQCKIFL